MLIQVCKSKIAHATVTEAELHYEGSITIDEDLMKAVSLLPFEQVDVLNLSTGSRIQTYVIVGDAGSGRICLNGPAARTGVVGDKIIVLSYGTIDQNDAAKHEAKIIFLDDDNKIKN